MGIAIRADQLSKRYTIGARDTHRTLRDSLVRAARWPRSGPSPPEFWALEDVTFELEAGTATGLIGANGAGKTTLLKLLSRITLPTGGRAELHGRVGSLLEVGTGFHPELTGRENILMSGAVLGMTRREVLRKFDEIVAFSQVEQFIDTPVKHYSSGMYVRLGFSVAAHLEPEILLVDEVLAVGDAAFQRKCLGKMDDVTAAGRTVIFVSHNMPAVTRLCQQAIWLDEGRVRAIGDADTLVSSYLDETSATVGEARLPADADRPMRLRRIVVRNAEDDVVGRPIEMSRPIRIEVEYDVNRPVTGAHVIVFVHTADGTNLLGSGDADIDPTRLEARARGRYRGTVDLPGNLLGEGRYTVTIALGVPYVEVYDRHEALGSFEVVDRTSRRRQWQHQRRPGALGLELPWTSERIAEQSE